MAAPHGVVEPLLRWGQRNLRELPWRAVRDPWSILVSEVMLQQTQVSRVIDRWPMFLERFPTPTSCAQAPPAAVLELWQGMGYNRRALNLHRASSQIVEHHDGVVPDSLDALLRLSGVGPYTARAVLVFAFERETGVVDTNVGRLLARWSGSSLSVGEAQLMAETLVPPGDSWRWNQGLFDFATAVCTKAAPLCEECPVTDACVWQGRGADPAASSAGVSAPQSRFAGSRREIRGRVVELLRAGPAGLELLLTDDLMAGTAHDVDAIIESLISEGLVERVGAILQLAGTSDAS